MKNFFNHQDEIKKFNDFSKFWWDKNKKNSPFKILHEINPIRLDFIKKNSKKFFDLEASPNLNILDIGCGGGILTEELQKIFHNSSIIGIDPGFDNIEIAKKHSDIFLKDSLKKPDYINIKFEDFALNNERINEDKKFDIICAIEVIEHVEDIYLFLDLINKLLKKSGLIFISTINRNIKSYILGIIFAEYILKFLPKKTHDWKKFLKPSEIFLYLSTKEKYKIIQINGIEFNSKNFIKSKIFNNKELNQNFELSNNADVNYILCLQKL
jgi:2-polyprenyl-6-hydroxyphenyl methylase/3-demethylubiquinone-9 3-methyltransferase